MKRQASTILGAVCIVCVLCVGQGKAQDNMGRYIVTLEGPSGPVEQAVISSGGVVLHVYDLIPAVAISIPEPALAGLERNPKVVSIEPDVVATATKRPAPPQPPSQPAEVLPWGVDRIDAEWAWSPSNGAGVTVGVVDTGIDNDHPDLQVVSGRNFVGTGPWWRPRVDPAAWDDDNGHGTHVAGIIAARDNEIGVIGVAPEASLYAVKVLDRSGSGWVSDIIAGIEWCVDNNIQVINMSLGASTDVQEFHNACDAASSHLLLVAAAGNEGGAVSYPAAYSSVIAVAATDSSDARASWSNFGPEVDIAAPGVGIYSTYMGGGYATLSGTSMAAPHVTGTLALKLGADIYGTADPIGLDAIYVGAGLVDAEEATTGSQTGDN